MKATQLHGISWTHHGMSVLQMRHEKVLRETGHKFFSKIAGKDVEDKGAGYFEETDA